MEQNDLRGSDLEFESLFNSVPDSTVFPLKSKSSRVRFLSRYSPYFDMDLKTCFSRLIQALHPLNRNFLVELDRPDLYGPLWLSFVVPFVMTVLGNLSVWSSSGSRWEFHFFPLIFCVVFNQVCVFCVPFGYVWFASLFIAPANATQVSCLLGYANSWMIPTGVVCFIVGSVADWLVAMIGGLLAAFSVYRKLQYPFDVLRNATMAFLPNFVLACIVWLNTYVCFLLLFR
jgi:hypothetical protein